MLAPEIELGSDIRRGKACRSLSTASACRWRADRLVVALEPVGGIGGAVMGAAQRREHEPASLLGNPLRQAGERADGLHVEAIGLFGLSFCQKSPSVIMASASLISSL